MKKHLLYLGILLSPCLEAQKTLYADIITKQNDTLENKRIRIMAANINLMETNDINIIWKVKVIDTLGNSEIVHSRDIKEMSFVDYEGKQRIYQSGRDQNELVEVMHNGKIKWTREYRRNSYDGAIMFYEVWTNEKRITEDTYQFKNRKNVLKRMTGSKPELAKLIDEGRLDTEKIKFVLTKYDEE